jgi:outer membrane protein OmpA-like peptidoglycan-associated protein
MSMSRDNFFRMGRRAALVLLVLVLLYAAAGFLLLPFLAQRYIPAALGQALGRKLSVDEFRANPFLLTFVADGVSLEGQPHQPLLTIRQVAVDASLRGVLQGSWRFDQVSLRGLRADIAILPDGSLDIPRVQGSAVSQASAASDWPIVRIGDLAVPDARVVLHDGRRPGEPALEVAPLDLHARDLSSVPGDPPASYELHAELARAGSLELRGRIALQDGGIGGNGHMRAAGLQAETLLGLLAPGSPLSHLQGRLQLSAAYAHDASGLGTLSGMAASATDVSATLRGKDRPLLQAAKVSVEGGEVDLGRRAISAARLHLATGRVEVVQDSGSTVPSQRGPARPAAPSRPWKVKLERLEVARMGLGYARHGKGAGVDVGAVDAHARLELVAGRELEQVVVTGIEAKVHAGSLSGAGPDPLLRLEDVGLAGGHFDLQRRLAGAERLAVAGSASLVRDRQGKFAWPSFAAEPGRGGPQPAWQYELGDLEVRSLDVALRDRSMEPALQLRGSLRGSVQDLSNDGTARFDASARLAGGGHLSAGGTLAMPTGKLEARFAARDVPLRPFQPVLEQVASLRIRSGTASASGRLLYGRDTGLSVAGDAGIRDLLVAEAASGDRFLSFKQLDLRGGSLDGGARRFSARSIDVREPGAKVVVSKDRHLNLLQVLGTAASGGQRGQGGAQRRAGPFAYEIGEIRLHGGEVDFADNSLVLPFSTTVTAVEGTLAGLSGDPARSAAVELEGSIQPYGSAQVSGTFVPAEPDRATDLRARFENVQVPPLSPYTATFAGRKVESGKLWLDLRYAVEDGQLRGSNDIRLRDFTLGARVEAPSALDVPLDLAVALLSDGHGQIRLSVPVTGEVGDAQFSVASAVKQAVGNVLRRVATAPFRALGRLFGAGDDGSLAVVGFEPGSASLQPQAREGLDTLARAMRERPRLVLVVPAPYEPRADARALQQEQARRALAAELGRELAPGEEPGAISFDDTATRRALERMLVARAGRPALAELQASHPQGGGGLYEAIFERVAAAGTPPDRSVQLLAVERARRIADYLRERGIEGSRLKTGTLATVSAGSDGEIAAQLQVAPGAGSPG